MRDDLNPPDPDDYTDPEVDVTLTTSQCRALYTVAQRHAAELRREAAAEGQGPRARLFRPIERADELDAAAAVLVRAVSST